MTKYLFLQRVKENSELENRYSCFLLSSLFVKEDLPGCGNSEVGGAPMLVDRVEIPASWQIPPDKSDLSNMWINRDLSYIFANGAQLESILVQGPRQVGKSSFLEYYAPAKPRLVVLDGLALRELADRANRAQ